MSGPQGEKATHRGIRWRRAGQRVAWWDAEGRRWVPYQAGDDAPPRPPGWEAAGTARRPRVGGVPRAGWRSPYRIVPVVLAVAAVIVALVQAMGSGTQVQAEAQASAALLEHCLAQNGSAHGHPSYSSTPVSCSSAKARVKVVAVVPSAPGQARACPAGTTQFEVPYAGVRYPHLECLRSLRAPG